MDLGKLFKNIKNITEYCTITKDLLTRHGNSKIQFNMSTVLSLKKIRSFEVEYYEKYEKNGAAFILYERMFQNQPSKTWKLLGKDMVSMLLYWLEAAKRHLDSHNTVWWPFIASLLNLIRDIRLKDRSLPNVLVEEMSACLLGLATDSQLDAMQSYEVLGCFNLFSAMASREIRFALREQLDKYFLKLAATLATCGHFPTQFNIVETLLRWLLRRQERAVRQAAADRWFDTPLYRHAAVAVFLERTFQNFFQDARDFLNAHNRGGDLVTSLVCKRVTIDGQPLVSGTDRWASWLDINASSRSLSLMLDPRMMETIGVPEQTACDALVVRADNTRSVRLHRVSSEVVISLCTLEPARLQAGARAGSRLQLALGSRGDAAAAHRALSAVFGDKYQMELDSVISTSSSPQRGPDSAAKKFSGSEEDTTFANPVEVKRRKHSGFCARPRFPVSMKSPSTTSTTSLAQLHEKLAALPRFAFDKELTSVCSRPELSVVNELSEIDEPSSFDNTFVNTRRRAYGVSKKESQKKGSQSDGDVEDKTIKRKCVSPVLHDECSTSCLLIATIGSDESVINDTLDRLSKDKDFNTDNIVDLLLREAMQAKTDDKLLDSGINTFENVKKTQNFPEVNSLIENNSEVIENTPFIKGIDKVISKKPETETNLRKISMSRDESNFKDDEVSANFVNLRKRNIHSQHDFECKKDAVKSVDAERTFDVQDADFFSQHFANNKKSDVAISPTLAKKLNETSSEDSCGFDQPLISIYKNQEGAKNLFEVDEIDIIACLNSVIDKVCEDFDKCTKYLDIENNASNFLSIPIDVENELEEDANTMEHNQTNENLQLRKCKSVKLKYKTAMKKKNVTKQRNASKRDKKKNVSDMPQTTVIDNIDLIENANKENGAETINEIVKESINQQKTALVSKKRKLFSPKQQHINMNKDVVHIPETEDDDTTHSDLKTFKNITPKSHVTSYKELENACRQRIRLPRSKKSKALTSELSPRTKKMNTIFDNLKEDVDYKEKLTHADGKTDEHDLAVYNFTSDSEDEDFKKKTLKRTSTTALASGGSNASRRGRKTNRVNYNESKYSSADENKDKKSAGKRKKPVKRKTPKRKEGKANIGNIDNTMIDERMRDAAPDDFNRSLVVEEPNEVTIPEQQPKITSKHQMEIICDDDDLSKESDNKSEVAHKRNKNRKILSIKKEKNIKTKAKLDIIKGYDGETSESPLPGLVVEKVPRRRDDTNDSLTVNMTQKFQKIYRDGPDACINDTNMTKNFLSNIERNDYSPRDRSEVDLCDLTEELNGTSKHVKSMGAHTKSYDDDIEVMNICEIDENTSEKSIATIGNVLITAHGDSDEPPPDQDMLNKTIMSRDLEKEKMDQSCLDFYNALTKQINKMSSNSKEEERIGNVTNARKVLSRQASDGRSVKSSSPVVSIVRLSPDDIRKWLPSRRSTETDNSNLSIDKEKEIEAPKSPVIVPIKRLSSNEFTNFLSSLRKAAPDSVSEKSEQVQSVNKENKSINAIKCIDTNKISEDIVGSSSKIARKSVISPIKLFDEYKISKRTNAEIISDNEDCVKEKKYIKSNLDRARIKENESTELKEIASASGSRGYNLRSLRTADHSTSGTKSSRTKQTMEDNTSNRLAHKRKPSPVKEVSKKLRATSNQDAATVSGSCLSVDEWLRWDAPSSSPEERMNTFITDVVHNVLEKVDTSLEEINQNTTKQLVSMFVGTRERLARLDEQHLALYRSTAANIVRNVVSIIDDNFAQLHKSSQELKAEFEDELKRRAAQVVRDDLKQKRAVAVLLRDEVQAAAEFMKQKLAKEAYRDEDRRK